jgi:hypothetical protein
VSYDTTVVPERDSEQIRRFVVLRNYPALLGCAVAGMGGLPAMALLSAERIGIPCLRSVEM